MSQRELEHAKIYKKEYEWRNGPKLASLRVGEDLEITVAAPSLPSSRNSPTLTSDSLIRAMYCEADAVVAGTVKSKASQLTEDGTFTFTTYQMTVTQVLKNNAIAPIVSGNNIEVTRPGGAILMNGRVITVRDESYPSLDPHGRYLLFLRFIASTGSYKEFRRGSDFQLTADTFSPLRGASMTEDLQRGGQTESLVNLISAMVVTRCNN